MDGESLMSIGQSYGLYIIAGLLNIYLLWKYRLYFMSLVAVWALAAIAVANQGNNLIVGTSTVIAAIILLYMITRILTGRKKNLIAH